MKCRWTMRRRRGAYSLYFDGHLIATDNPLRLFELVLTTMHVKGGPVA